MNPFNPNDKSDLVSQAEADAVKRDFLQAGKLEDQALAENDPQALRQEDTGNRLRVLLDLCASSKDKESLRDWSRPPSTIAWSVTSQIPTMHRSRGAFRRQAARRLRRSWWVPARF